MTDFPVFVLNPPGLAEQDLVIAAGRAGAIGVCNGEYGLPYHLAAERVRTIARYNPAPFGLKLPAPQPGVLRSLGVWRELGLHWLILDAAGAAAELEQEAVARFRAEGGRVLLEARGHRDLDPGLEGGMDGWWLKGHEAGGLTGEEGGFVLLQRAAGVCQRPLFLRGGVGPGTAPACRVGGAAGLVLDDQLLLLRESPLAEALAGRLANLSGTETTAFGDEAGGVYLRLLERPGFAAAAALRERLAAGAADLAAEAAAGIGWTDPARDLMPLGQAAAFAADWRRRYGNLHRALRAIADAAAAAPAQAAAQAALSAGSPLAHELGIRYPIVQGAMSRVSDVPAFARAVGAAGAMPVLALAMMRGPQAEQTLAATQALLGGEPWGVGLLGFVAGDLHQEQMTAVRRHRPTFAYIAGGRPEQAAELEALGLPTFLHVPTRALLDLFLDQGARRFIFEGRECGGHVGPLSCLTLWESMTAALSELDDGLLSEISVLFAGGIHDAASAAMAAALAAPLVARGLKIGVLMGTAYLFTPEAVETGAIRERFQRVALACDETATLTTGPGHASRCARTPFVDDFHRTKARWLEQALDAQEIRRRLDDLSLGRLRVASKGLQRSAAGALEALSEAEQLEQGMYMIGQAAVLHRERLPLAELHRNVTAGAAALLQGFQAPEPAPPPAARPADIAVVGVGSILPGAPDTRAYWENLMAGVAAIREIPPERWDWRLYFTQDRRQRDRVYSRWGGFLDDVPFDPLRYGMPPRSLKSIDPLQLLTLEAVRQGLEDAGLDGPHTDREGVSVILGASGGLAELGLQYATRSDLPRVVGEPDAAELARLPEWTEDSFAGLLLNVAAGRAANRFDFGGVNCTVDAACASSLAAVYQGVQELLSGNSEVVVAGGVDTAQSPFSFLCFAKTQALSPSGRCRTFDREADGIAISEGLAVVVLKRLADAERDGDRIYGVIKGVAGSSDGRAKGLTAPRPEGQIRALRRAYAQAGYSPATLGLLEAHGTGTVAGDSAEMQTIGRLMEEAGAEPGSCALGSVKSLIGHTKAAAGVAGMVKALLALYHRVLPLHYGVARPLPALQAADSALHLCTQPQPWVRHPGHPRRAGVSAFGFGGSNFHVALEEYADDYRADRRPRPLQRWPAELFVWRGKDRAAIGGQLAALESVLARGDAPPLRELAYAAALAAAPAGATLALAARDHDDLARKLQGARGCLHGDREEPPEDVWLSDQPLLEAGRLALLFPGQGAQYPGMLRELALVFDEVREALEQADAVLREPVAAASGGRRLSQLVYPPVRFDTEADQAARATLTRTEFVQPALGALSGGLLRLLEMLGLQPEMAAGHSYGEYAALHAAGVLGFDDLLRLSEARGRFIVEQAAGGELGTMAAARASWARVGEVLDGLEGVVRANHNGPEEVIISGTRQAVAQAIARLEAAGIAAKPIPVAAAFHSPLVESAKQRLAELLAQTPFHKPAFAVYSNAAAAPHDEAPDAIRAAMAEHLTAPVDFLGEIEAMYGAGARVFLEVGPKPILSRLTGRILGERPHRALALDASGDGLTDLLRTLGGLLAEGARLDLRPLFAGRTRSATQRAGAAEPLPAHFWLVNGGCARPADGPCVTGLSPMLNADTRRGSGARSPSRSLIPSQPEVRPMGDDPKRRQPPPAGSLDAAMLAYQQTMQQFLSMQERVMTAYLGQDGAGASELPPLPEMPQPAFAPAAVAAASPASAPPDGPSTAAPVEPPAAAAPPATEAPALDLGAALLGVAAERTGYPVEMLGLDQDIEADLGIDSIKRVEILGAFQKDLPRAAADRLQDRMGELNALRTFQEMLDWLEQAAGGASGAADSTATQGGDASPFESAEADEPGCAPLPRYVVQAHPEPVETVILEPLRPGLYLVVADGVGLAAEVVRRIEQQGATTLLIRPEEIVDIAAVQARLAAARNAGPVRGLIHLAPFDAPPLDADTSLQAWRARMQWDLKSLFTLLRLTGEDLQQDGRLITVSGMGGLFARDETPNNIFPIPSGGGLSGLVKTLSFEWVQDMGRPNFRAKALDLDPQQAFEDLAAQVLQELLLPGGRREVGYPQGRRTIFRTIPDSVTRSPTPALAPDRDWVVLAVGGARGITAECLRGFLPYRPTLVLAGRSALQGSEDLPDSADPAVLRRHFLGQAAARNEKLRPAEVEQAVQKARQRREMAAVIAEFEQAGARVDYRALDIRDEDQVAGLFDDLYDRYGRIDAVLQGAGIIEDKLLLDKTDASIARVFDTKADSAFLLGKYLRPEQGLKFLAFFTSVAGRYGNRGQSDYAAANETVARFAWCLHRRWGGRVKVAAIHWNPWDQTTHGAGMVTAAVKAEFEARGVWLVSAEQGRQLLMNELLYAAPGAVDVIAGDHPWEYREAAFDPLPAAAADPALAPWPLLSAARREVQDGGARLRKRMDLVSDPYLDQHRLDGVAVLPFACVIEHLAEAAAMQAQMTAPATLELRDLRRFNGLALARGQDHAELVIDLAPADPDGYIKTRLLQVAPKEQPLYQGEVLVSGEAAAAAAADAAVPAPAGATAHNAASVYRHWLFHGPVLQTITAIRGLDAGGVDAVLRTTAPGAFHPPAAGRDWLLDPGVIDGAFQLVLLWSRAMRNATTLPSRLQRIVRYGAEPLPAELHVYHRVVGEHTGAVISDIRLCDDAGRLRLLVEGLEGTLSSELNRLGGTWAGGRPRP